ncbi:MAG TPA: hypothetical protein VG722_08155 [Tepidisphaeraceae bacterium]|nr:hypothetical protein [Tepidisphaeraceae bacterium]
MAIDLLLQIIRLLIAVGLGLFASGYFLARCLRSSSAAVLAFPLSLVVLFYCIFLVGLCGIPITFGSVLIPLLIVCGGLGWMASHQPARSAAEPAKYSRHGFMLIALGVVSVLMLIQQSLLTPLSGYDTIFRWDYLARRILELHTFGFYPPIRAADFKDYYFVDGFPPILSFAYWWVYAAFGSYVKQLSAIVVVPQYVVVLWLTFKLARHLAGSKIAGALAVAILATSSAYFRDQVIGQESGLMAVSLLALLWVLLVEPASWRSMVLAAGCAALGAMCREYGWAYVLFGLVLILCRHRSYRMAAIFFAGSLLLAGPWYLRNFILTGNPFYSLKFLWFPVNQVFAGMMESYRPHFGVMAWNAARWREVLIYLLAGSPIQLTLGIAAMIALLKRSPWLGIAVVMSSSLWLYSAGYTNGGPNYSTRTLAPAWAILSVCAAVWAVKWDRPMMRAGLSALIVISFAAAVVSAWIFPFSFFNRPTGSWVDVGLHGHPWHDPAEAIVPQVKEQLPRTCRILGDGLVAYPLLRKAGYQLVPPWSPEVSFLFDPTVSARQATERLEARHICAVLVVPEGTNTYYFVGHSHFYQNPTGWKLIGAAPEARLFRLPSE